MMKMRPLIFVSHISEEAELAKHLKNRIERDFLGMVNLFISSDGESISAGSKWLDSIEEALRDAQIEIVLCSRESVSRPWINFEAGAGWIKEIPIVPVCHTDLSPSELPVPLNMLQSISASESSDLETLYDLIAKRVQCRKPSIDFTRFASELKAIEDRYNRTESTISEALNDSDGLERRARAGDEDAIMQLSVSGSSNVFESLVSILERSPDEKVRATTVSAIANLDDPRKTRVLGEVLLKERWTVAAACAQALGRSKDKSAIPYLTKALDISVDWTVGQKSAEALGFYPPSDETVQALIRALNRGESFAAEAAMQSLVSFGNFAVSFLIENLHKATSFQSISYSVRVLSILRDKRAIPELEMVRERLPDMDAEDQWKQKLISEIDQAILTIKD